MRKKKNFRMPNGFGSVYKLKGNRRKPWTAVYKKHYIGYYETEQDARHALEMYKEVPYDLENKNITISRLYEILLERKKDKSKSTLSAYLTAYNHLAEIQRTPLRNLRTHDFQKILDNSGLKRDGKNQIRNLLNQLYKIAMELDILTKNYAQGLDCGKSEKSTLHKPFTELEIRKLWELSKTDTFAEIPLILCYTGLRPQELCEIQITDVNLEKRYLTGGIKTEAGKNRIIPLHSSILPIFSRRMETNNKYIIETPKGKKYNYKHLLPHWREFMKKAELNHQPHDGRHTFITFAKRKKMDALILKRIVGHAATDITEKTYTHTDYTDLVAAIDNL